MKSICVIMYMAMTMMKYDHILRHPIIGLRENVQLHEVRMHTWT